MKFMTMDIIQLLIQIKDYLSEKNIRKDKKIFIGLGNEKNEFYVGYFYSFNDKVRCYQIITIDGESMEMVSSNAIKIYTIADSYEDAIIWLENKLNLANRTTNHPIFQSFHNSLNDYKNFKNRGDFLIGQEKLYMYYEAFEDIEIFNKNEMDYLLVSLLSLIGKKDLDRKDGRNYYYKDTIDFAYKYRKWVDEKFLGFYTINLKNINKDIRIGAALVIDMLKSEQGLDEITKIIKNEPHPDVRKKFVSVLGLSRNKKYFPFIRERFLNDPQKNVRSHAAIALGGIKDNRAIDLLKTKLLEEDLNVKFASARAIGRYKNERIFNLLIKLLTATPPYKEQKLKAGICHGLLLQRNKEAVPTIISILNDIKNSKGKKPGPTLVGNLIYTVGILGDESIIDFMVHFKKNIDKIIDIKKKALIFDDKNPAYSFIPVRKILDDSISNLKGDRK